MHVIIKRYLIMAHLEIDRLRTDASGNSEGGAIDLQLDTGLIGCLISRDTEGLLGIADALTGFGRIYVGRIFLGGNVIVTSGHGRTGITACGYNIGLYEHLNAADNLAVPLHASGISDFETVARVDAAIDDFGLSEIAGEYPEDLEEDEKLRLSFAKAAISSPGLIVCYLVGRRFAGFEQYSVLSTITRYVRGHGLTLLTVTDNGFNALTIADQISYLRNGAIIQQGAPRDFITSPESLEIAEDFSFPMLNKFEGIINEESPFLFVESGELFFNLPERLRDYFRARIGAHQFMAVRPEKVHLVHPDEVQRRGRNIVNLSRVDNFGFGSFAYFDFGELYWCAFLPSNRIAYPGMRMGVFVPEEEWFFLDNEGNILLDL